MYMYKISQINFKTSFCTLRCSVSLFQSYYEKNQPLSRFKSF
jgi:hypothetical protein